jgi:hypothetical protein
VATWNVRDTCVAGSQPGCPNWLALIVHEPGVAVAVTVAVVVLVGATSHVVAVLDAKVTGNPEVTVALTVIVVLTPMSWGWAKVIVCEPTGVTEFDGADATLVSGPFAAVTVNV